MCVIILSYWRSVPVWGWNNRHQIPPNMSHSVQTLHQLKTMKTSIYALYSLEYMIKHDCCNDLIKLILYCKSTALIFITSTLKISRIRDMMNINLLSTACKNVLVKGPGEIFSNVVDLMHCFIFAFLWGINQHIQSCIIIFKIA